MRRKLRKHASLVALLAIALIAATAAYAYASSINNVNPPPLGSGSGSIGKYSLDASSVSYTLDAADPELIDAVSFSLGGSSTSTVVRVRLIDSGGSWYSCSSSAAPTISCSIPAIAAASANGNHLTVVAAG
jgi:hypothetical protein